MPLKYGALFGSVVVLIVEVKEYDMATSMLKSLVVCLMDTSRSFLAPKTSIIQQAVLTSTQVSSHNPSRTSDINNLPFGYISGVEYLSLHAQSTDRRLDESLIYLDFHLTDSKKFPPLLPSPSLDPPGR
jgi:hypothetical protein